MALNVNIADLLTVRTPFYYYDMDLLEKTLDTVKSLSEKYGISVHYAVKANNEKKILRKIASYGFGADCVSGNEVLLCAENGFAGNKIMFAGVGKTDKEIYDALKTGIYAFNVESVPEMKVIDRMAGHLGVKANIQFRINPNIDAHTHKYITTGLEENKFGIPHFGFADTVSALKDCRNLNFLGIQFHVGSQITDVENVYALVCRRMNEIVAEFEAMGVEVRSIDLGGGLGIDYGNPDEGEVADFATWMRVISENIRRREGQEIHVEPGRSLVAQCGSLMTKVLYVKNGEKKNFAIVDAGMNDLIRPALYQAYHRIDNLCADEEGRSAAKYDVVGPVCESSDVFGEDRELGLTGRGDLLAIRSAGAYGAVMASRYNAKEFAQAVFSDDIDSAEKEVDWFTR
ncbi:MAG: diaminopimelate decarboxylase [Bacteroidales bacterium]|nr:diaminopimelate decarboxylase [Bacteroidales bacterium]